jgi:hypothetical protein
MAGIFDDFDRAFDTGEGRSESDSDEDQASQAAMDSLDADDGIDEELREAEKLLAKAAYYKAIVRNGVIEDDGTTQAVEVNAEAKIWARQMMGKMLGRNQPEPVKVESPFTENEVKALKKLAGFALAKMGELPADPVVKKIEAPPVPTVRKVPAQTKPALQPSKKPAAPPAKKPPVKPQPPARNGKKHRQPGKVAINDDGTPDYESIPTQETFADVDGALCKMVENPAFNPDVKGSKPRSKVKITSQVKVAGGFPPPNRYQMESLSQSQSMETISAGVSASATSAVAPDEHANQTVFIAAAAKSLQE